MIVDKTKPLAIHDWDWKQQPDFEDIGIVINDFQERFNNGIKIIEVDTGCDGYAIVIGDKTLTEEMAKQAYQNRFDIENGIDAEELDWEAAKGYLKYIRQEYVDIGTSGIFALNAVINPLLIRFESNERTKDLYDAIMNLS
jgi:hypothetical protein